ncbi:MULTISPECIES: Uma2 family endonuclease [Nonomuraea]|uniref:Uma2 family endonuclease n=1 Tax=Nonomuraea ferruginea TaxID=46174 RepID=A0ABT4T0M4_9ACTN|nr:Uma2 family endonuclease [Nonomuraea ferruginea]MDA0643048.1 Uma2 family endonuclease [Nonomuraea ferruginea]
MIRPVEERYRTVRDVFPELRVELVNGRIVVNEPGTWQHNTIIAQLIAQLAPVVAGRGWEIWPNITVHLGDEADRYVPDLTIVPQEPVMETDEAVHGASTLLLVDVVSAGNAYDDHVIKPMGYAPAGVPLYLVVDPFQRLLKLHSDPAPSGYGRETVEPAGAPLTLPHPWDCAIDTTCLLNL